MDKPASLLQREFEEKIIDAINTSSLPAFVLIPVLEQAVRELERLKEEQYKADLAAYEVKEDG